MAHHMRSIYMCKHVVSSLLIICGVWKQLEAHFSEPHEHFSSFCETETFNATCPSDHVVLITHARYGRMKLSRCVKMDYGHIGCSSDVISAADSRCSGRRKCEIRVPDSEFAKNKPCPDDLKPYLEAGFTCVRVQTPVTPCLVGQQTTTGIPVTSTSGYLSSVVADSTGCGRMRSPWSITVQRGQTIRITLYDFGLHSRSKIRTSHVAGTPVTPPPCVLYAVLREPLAAIAQNISVCGGLQRQSVIYTSTTHRLDVGMVHSDQNNHIPHFLLQYTAVGCPDLPVASNSWPVRHGDGAIVRCNFTKEVYHLKCSGNTWSGDIANCTAPQVAETNVEKIMNSNQSPISYGMSVAIVLVLAFSIGLIVLSIGLLLIKRRHHLCVRHGSDEIGGVNSSHTASRHLHTHQSDLYDSFTASKYCVAKTLLLADVSDSSDFTPRTAHRHNCVHNQPPHRCMGSSDDVILSSPARHTPYSPRLSAAASQSRHCLRDDADVTSRRAGAVKSCECCMVEPGNSLLMLSGGCVVCNQRPAVSGATSQTEDDLQHQQYYVIDRRHRQELVSTRASKHSHSIADDSNVSLRRAGSATSLTVSGPDRLVTAPPPGDLQPNHVDLTFQHASTAFKDDVTVT